MTDGVFSSKVFGETGVATERQFEAGGLEAAIDPLVVEGRAFPQLAVDGFGFKIKNRSDHVTRYFPRAAVAVDEFPSRGSNTMVATNVAEGAFWVSQAVRRRAILARSGISYLAHFSGDPAPTADDLALAREFVEQHKSDPDTEAPASPLERISYEDSMVRNLGVSFDPATGVGVRTREE